MTKVKVLTFDAKTKKRVVVERDINLPVVTPEVKAVDLTKVKKLLTHAEDQGWI